MIGTKALHEDPVRLKEILDRKPARRWGLESVIADVGFEQCEGDLIINEIGNSGTKKAMYTRG